MPILSQISMKDWLIAAALVSLILCILQIHRLKKSIVKEVQKRVIPQLNLELTSGLGGKELGLFLRNDSFFLVRDIKIEDVDLVLDDFGYRQNLILKFAEIDFLKPHEQVQLELKVFNKNQEFLQRVTETILPHLISPVFKVIINYSNVENLRLRVVFSKKAKKFTVEKVETCG